MTIVSFPRTSSATQLEYFPERLLLGSIHHLLWIGNLTPEAEATLRRDNRQTILWNLDPATPIPAFDKPFDAIIFDKHFSSLTLQTSAAWRETIISLLPLMAPHTCLHLYANEPAQNIHTMLESGIRPYHVWICPPDQAHIMAVQADYDPIVHARAHFAANHIDWSLEILANIPKGYLMTEEAIAQAASDRQLGLLAWDRTQGGHQRLERFFCAQREFYTATTYQPRERRPYLVQAAFWTAIGNTDMAYRIMNSIDFALDPKPQPPYRGSRNAPQTAHAEPPPPEWDAKRWKPRILFFSHEESDYGLDTLIHGLHQVLGAENVVDFPWKPTIHGQTPEKTYGYPCFFNLPGQPIDKNGICEQLRAGAFDAVVYIDTLRSLNRAMVHQVLEAAGETPLVLMDTWDEGGNYFPATLEHIGRTQSSLNFKREMLIDTDYGPNTYPLPFSYPQEQFIDTFTHDRPEAVFWAGKRICGLRALYLDYLAGHRNLRFERTYPPAEYLAAIRKARIGLNFFGLGFDTVRYWELPAQGCLLLAERLPIRIPHNFTDGENAVFFENLPDLDRKLQYFLEHPEESARIAQAGHLHARRYHTNTARARQFLGRLQAELAGPG